MIQFGTLPSVTYRAIYGFLSFVDLLDARRVSSRMAHELSPAQSPQLWRALRPGFVTSAFARWLEGADLSDTLAFDAVYDFVGECRRSPGMMYLVGDIPRAAAIAACARGQLAKLRWLCDGPLLDELGPVPLEGIRRASEGGHLHVVQWVLARAMWTQGPWYALMGACTHGRSDIVELLHRESRIDGFVIRQGSMIYNGSCPISLVCEHGHLDILQWMVKTYDLDRNTLYRDGIRQAYRAGHEQIVEWLTSRFGLADETMLIPACVGGLLPTVQRLFGPWETSITTHEQFLECLWVSCKRGHLRVVEWLTHHTSMVQNLMARALIIACTYGHLDLARWILETFPAVKDTLQSHVPHLWRSAADHLMILQWLATTFGPLTETDLKHVLAAAHGHQAVVQWLVTEFKFTQGALRLALYAACIRGQLESAQFLAQRMRSVDWPSLLRSTCERGHLPVTQWLLSFNTTVRARTVWYPAWTNALDGGHTLVAADLAGRFEFTTDDARRCAAFDRVLRSNNLDLAYWVVTHFDLSAADVSGALHRDATSSHVATWLRLHFDLYDVDSVD